MKNMEIWEMLDMVDSKERAGCCLETARTKQK